MMVPYFTMALLNVNGRLRLAMTLLNPTFPRKVKRIFLIALGLKKEKNKGQIVKRQNHLPSRESQRGKHWRQLPLPLESEPTRL